ncbi:aminodeoxychorismate synthase component I [Streptococcus iniae]|uniref:aminodeoxychorismate synthase component I n=1 Tax=Streptococcus iniae TaxID=1346 RepID=UPI002B2CDB0B|nr:aminodeoxychorismate synthase component I [Streptococcus iniae]
MHIQTIIDFKELGCRYIFKQPLYELIAKEISEVGQVLQSVSDYQAKGYYVVGYVSYEATSYFDANLCTHQKNLGQEYYAYFTVHDACQNTPIPRDYESIKLPNNWLSLIQEKEYQRAIEQIHHEMRQGNTYQVNFTTQLTQELPFEESLAIYNRLVVEQGAGYNAYVAHDQVAIISASPELFFKKEDKTIITRPMKGTTKRGPSLQADKAQYNWLIQDPKNRSENMMIVDLLRNDMGKICQTGTVQVTKLCQLEQYSTVWQMTSTIEGQLLEDKGLVSIFDALFPCGSITGAPKVSTMNIITRLEKEPRGVYCGNIGICLPNGDCIFNVAIRTIQLFDRRAVYGVGGGITWESQWQDEFEEIKQKSAVLYKQKKAFTVITTAKLSQQTLHFYDKHIKRLKEACAYFDYPFDQKELEKRLADYLVQKDQGDYRLSVAIDLYGHISLSDQVLTPLDPQFLEAKVVRQDYPVENFAFANFKTSYRPHLKAQASEQIFVSPEGKLLETSIGNLILDIDGEWLTPVGTLPIIKGIHRQELLEQGKLKEADLTIEDLEKASAIYGTNSVRGLYPLTISKN